jgi:hypothetical protein
MDFRVQDVATSVLSRDDQVSLPFTNDLMFYTSKASHIQYEVDRFT